jgi:hypothetical protein
MQQVTLRELAFFPSELTLQKLEGGLKNAPSQVTRSTVTCRLTPSINWNLFHPASLYFLTRTATILWTLSCPDLSQVTATNRPNKLNYSSSQLLQDSSLLQTSCARNVVLSPVQRLIRFFTFNGHGCYCLLRHLSSSQAPPTNASLEHPVEENLAQGTPSFLHPRSFTKTTSFNVASSPRHDPCVPES